MLLANTKDDLTLHVFLGAVSREVCDSVFSQIETITQVTVASLEDHELNDVDEAGVPLDGTVTIALHQSLFQLQEFVKLFLLEILARHAPVDVR